MKVFVISPHKLRVELDEPELLSYGIDYESLKYDTPQTKEIISSAISKAKLASGIDFRSPRMLIEAKMTGSKVVFLLTRIDNTSIFDNIKKTAAQNGEGEHRSLIVSSKNLCAFVTSAEKFGIGGQCHLFKNNDDYMIEFAEAVDGSVFMYLCSEFNAEEIINPYKAAKVHESWENVARGVPFWVISHLYGR